MGLFSRAERMLGIDLGPSSIKLVELSRSGRKYQVEAVSVRPLPEGCMADRNPGDPLKVSEMLIMAHKESGSRLKGAAMAVPTSSVITRTINMPSEYNEDDIEASIQIEAAQYIPFPLDEIHLDFQVLPQRDKSSPMQEVMLVASRRENVELRDEVMRDAGLKPLLVDIEAYALENVFPLMVDSAEERIALVDIGSSVTTLYVFSHGKVIFTREQMFGGDQLTQSVIEHYQMERDDAERVKCTPEDQPGDYDSEVLEPFRQLLVEQVSSSVQFFFSASHYNSIDRMLLIGGCARVHHLVEALSDVLQIEVEVANPFAGMSAARKVNSLQLEREGPAMAMACGLAMRSFG